MLKAICIYFTVNYLLIFACFYMGLVFLFFSLLINGHSLEIKEISSFLECEQQKFIPSVSFIFLTF